MKFDWKKLGAICFATLTAVSMIPFENGGIGDVMPPHWKPKLLALGICATFILRIWSMVSPPANE